MIAPVRPIRPSHRLHQGRGFSTGQATVKARQTNGRESTSIKPGQYSGPIHIHAHLYAAGRPEWFIREFMFADDPLIPAKERAEFARYGRFSPMLTLHRSGQWILVGERDIMMTKDPRKPFPPRRNASSVPGEIMSASHPKRTSH